MKKVLGLGLLVLGLLAGCSSAGENDNGKQIEDQEASLPAGAEPEILADELDIPWSIAKMGETFYMTERQGSIVKVEDGKKERQKVELAKSFLPPLKQACSALCRHLIFHNQTKRMPITPTKTPQDSLTELSFLSIRMEPGKRTSFCLIKFQAVSTIMAAGLK